MKETPLLYTPENVVKVYKDLKTQTRRLSGLEKINEQPDQWRVIGVGKDTSDTGRYGATFFNRIRKTEEFVSCPYGGPGDRLWVREAHRYLYSECENENDNDNYMIVEFKDGEKHRALTGLPYMELPQIGLNWRSPIHLHQWAARLWLELTEVRVERLWQISEEDCRAEGIEWRDNGLGIFRWTFDGKHWFDYTTDAYLELWKSINGLDSWHADPWVWPLTFKQVAA